MKALVIDINKCNGCYNCQIACKDEHVANNWMPYAMPQPDTGQFWIGIQETVRGTVPKVMVSYLPKMCMHCEDAPCMKDCKADAIYKREDGLVIVDPAKCTGCKLCADTCPYDVIYFNEHLNIAQKCTGCAHLLDDGWDVPRCVDQCPTNAIKFADEKELADLIKKADPRTYKKGLKTNVHYLNLPKKFVGGTLYDPVEKEVVIGAKCTLTDTESDKAVTVKTDSFGDFWFRGLKDNRSYSLKLEKEGKVVAIGDISTEKDVNLGDIPLG